jgi:hypothetical protein
MEKDKSSWPDELQGYEIGNDGYLIVGSGSGENFKCYECETARNVNVNTTVSTIDTTTRRSGFFKEEMPGSAELSVDGEFLFDANDPCYQMLQEAYTTGKVITVGAFLSNGNGPWMRAAITDFSRSEELDGVVSVSAKYSNARFIDWFNEFEKTDATSYTIDKHPLYKAAGSEVKLHSKIDGVQIDGQSAQ